MLIISLVGILLFGAILVLIILDYKKEQADETFNLLNDFKKAVSSEEFAGLKDKIKEKGIEELFRELDKKEIFKAKKVDSTDSIKELKLQIEDVNQTIANHLVSMNEVGEFDNAIHVHKFVKNRLKDLVHKAGLTEFTPVIGDMYDYNYHRKMSDVEGEENKIINVLSPGYKDKNGVIILKANVAVGKGV